MALSWFCIWYDNDWGMICIRVYIHKRHPISRPYERVMGCLLVRICVKIDRVIQYIPRNMHTVFALLCFVVVIHWLIFPYPSGLLHWHCGNLTIAPVPAKQSWWIWINTSCEFIMNDCITTTKQSTTKPCAYFLGCTLCVFRSQIHIDVQHEKDCQDKVPLKCIPICMHILWFLLCFVAAQHRSVYPYPSGLPCCYWDQFCGNDKTGYKRILATVVGDTFVRKKTLCTGKWSRD